MASSSSGSSGSSSSSAPPPAVPAVSLPVAAAIVAAAQPAASAAPKGDIYQTYNPQGAMGGLFAPAYIAGYKPSEDAVAAWTASHSGLSRADIEATRMPAAWQAPQAVNPLTNAYGAGRIPKNETFGDVRGIVDPLALQAQAQGTSYDIGARRAAIAQQIAANQAASDAYAQQHLARYGYLPGADPTQGSGMTGNYVTPNF
jgi:hypothetical protein